MLKNSEMDELVSNIKKIINGFNEQLAAHLPALETEVNQLITKKEVDSKKIENHLDTLLSLCQLGIGNSLYIKLLEYYKTIDAEGANFYWKEYDNLED